MITVTSAQLDAWLTLQIWPLTRVLAVLSAAPVLGQTRIPARIRIALAIGIVFVFAVRATLLRQDHTQLNPWTLKLVALASLSIWFLVAASGRWIGFS